MPDAELQAEFDRLTAGGTDFGAYSKMANATVENVTEALEASDKSAVAAKGFELITWFARIPR